MSVSSWIPLVLSLSGSALSQEPPALQRFEYRQVAMGGEARIVLYAADEASAKAGAQAAFARIEALDGVLSDYRADSELMRLCAQAGKGAVEVSDDLFQALRVGRFFADFHLEGFDPTIGPLTHLWRKALAEKRIPSEEQIAKARALVGSENLGLFEKESKVELKKEGMLLDLGAFAKGYACDHALAVLKGQGLPRALVELGGDMAIGDPPPDAEGWRVDAGCDAAGTLKEPLLLSNCGFATSGHSARSVEVGGVRYSHMIDPRTGYPLASNACASAHTRVQTLEHMSGAFADAMATCMVLIGPRAGPFMELMIPQTRTWRHDPDEKPLFDGATLQGWTPRGGRYDGEALWTVEEGTITGRETKDGKGGLLYTARPYTNFHLELDVRVDHPFDSGLFLRMHPAARGFQITLDDRPGGEIGAVYADGYLLHNDQGHRMWRKNEWNQVAVRCIGFDPLLAFWSNGQQLSIYNGAAAGPGFAPTGLIGLQVHGGGEAPGEKRAQFRNIRIKPLLTFEDDFAPLPDGRIRALPNTKWADGLAAGLGGWQAMGDKEGYKLEGGVLAIPAKGGGWLATSEDYQDLRLRFDFKLAPGANSGVFLRAPRAEGDPAYSGCELQLIDDHGWKDLSGSELQPTQLTGSLYGSVPPMMTGLLRPAGEWNTLEVLYKGTRLAVALNGDTLYDVDTLKVPGKPFAERAKTGAIGFQRYGAPHVAGDTAMWIRNFFVERL